MMPSKAMKVRFAGSRLGGVSVLRCQAMPVGEEASSSAALVRLP